MHLAYFEGNYTKLLSFAVLIFGLFSGYLALIAFKNDYTHLGFQTAQIKSTMLLPKENGPPSLHLKAHTIDGHTLLILVRDPVLFANVGDVICVSIKQRNRNKKVFGTVVYPSKC